MHYEDDKKTIELLNDLKGKVDYFRIKNMTKFNYYYGNLRTKDLGINTPQVMQDLSTVIGWGERAVEAPLERLNFTGYYEPDEDSEAVSWLNSIFRQNYFEAEQKISQKDAGITGIGFISIGKGDKEKGEPEILWRTESPNNLYIEWNNRTLEISKAFRRIKVNNETEILTLWDLNTIRYFENTNGRFVELEEERVDHNLGVIPIVPVFNNPSSLFPRGRTAISRAIRTQIDSAMRTLLAFEVSREFYSNPMRLILGADISDLQTIEGGGQVLTTKSGSILNIPKNLMDDIMPTISEFSAGNPENIITSLETFARLVAREISVTPEDLGFGTINPSSADAINAAERKMIKKVDQMIPYYKRAYQKLAKLSFLVAGKQIPDNLDEIEPVFDRTDTITPQGASDRISKLHAIGIFERELPEWVYRQNGLSAIEIKQTRDFIRKNRNAKLLDSIFTPQDNLDVGESPLDE